LSPILFNAVMDWVLSKLDSGVGFDIGSKLLNHLAFADDIALISHTRTGMIRLCSQFEEAQSSVGLQVNPSKSASLALLVDGRNKSWLCDKTGFVNLRGEVVRGMDIGEVYRYLGTSIGARAHRMSMLGELEQGL
jgi:hypothetical protein